MIDDPEGFLQGIRGRRIVLDEIHRLERPSEILKIAADHFPDTRILATGSSTLGASTKFRDTLAGRKEELWLTPMTTDDLDDFGGAYRFAEQSPLFRRKKLKLEEIACRLFTHRRSMSMRGVSCPTGRTTLTSFGARLFTWTKS
jgi:predicted AAA+ superfamily ATPase